MMQEIELLCCGTSVRFPANIVNEFNNERILLIQLANGDHVSPIVIEMLSKFWIAINQTQIIIIDMKAAAA